MPYSVVIKRSRLVSFVTSFLELLSISFVGRRSAQSLFPVTASWIDTKVRDEEPNEVNEGKIAGRNVHLSQGHRPATGHFDISDPAGKVHVRRGDRADAKRVPVKREDFAGREIRHLIPVPDPANRACGRVCIAVDGVLLDDRDADRPRSRHTPESHEFAGWDERNLVPAGSDAVTGGEQWAIGDIAGDLAEPRDIGIDGRFRSLGGQAESS